MPGNPLESTTSFEEDIAALLESRWEAELVGVVARPLGRVRIPPPPCRVKLQWVAARGGVFECVRVYRDDEPQLDLAHEDGDLSVIRGEGIVFTLNLVVTGESDESR